MEAHDILMTIAQVAATFVGFASVVFAVGRVSLNGVTRPERTALIQLLIPFIVALFLAFAPAVAFLGVRSVALIWRVGNGVLGVIHLALIANAARAAVGSRLLDVPPLRFFLMPGGFLAIAANGAVVLGFFAEYAGLIYISGLVWLLLVSAAQFVILVLLHATAPERTAIRW